MTVIVMMKEFLLEYYNVLTNSVEFIAALTAVLVYKKYKYSIVKYFLWFLIYVFAIELIGGYTVYVYKYAFLSDIQAFLKGTLIESNHWWYTIAWTLVSALFFATYFMTVIKNRLFKKIIGWSRLLLFLISVLHIVFNIEAFFTSTLKLNRILSALVVLITVTLYFIDVLQSDKILKFYKSVNFYIAAVVFIWFLAITPVMFYDVYFSRADWNFVFLKWEIFLYMNIFMYITFTFVLLCCKPKNV